MLEDVSESRQRARVMAREGDAYAAMVIVGLCDEVELLRTEARRLRTALKPLAKLTFHRDLEPTDDSVVLVELDSGSVVNRLTVGDAREARELCFGGQAS